jgi:hypothetical protein
MISIRAVGSLEVATETVEISQVAPILDMDFFEVQTAQGMGGLMYQQAQLLMKRMQENPDLAIWRRPPTDNPKESPTGASYPESISLSNINGSGNPDPTVLSVRLLAIVMTQPEMDHILVKTRAPNPLRNFINIYSDDERSESSHNTPVHVQE